MKTVAYLLAYNTIPFIAIEDTQIDYKSNRSYKLVVPKNMNLIIKEEDNQYPHYLPDYCLTDELIKLNAEFDKQ